MSAPLPDLSDLPLLPKGYGGANGGKLCVIYAGEQYMIKYPAHARRNPRLHYANSCVAEHIGCRIFASLGIPAQETMLATRRKTDGNASLVVACKDFTQRDKLVFQDFAALKNSTIVGTPRSGYGVELAEVESALEELAPRLKLPSLEDWFWDMFIVDALIGNWDRHNGNWGFLYDPRREKQTLAPVFDCGSSLYASADEEQMRKILGDKKEMDVRITDWPFSALKEADRNIRYFDFITSLRNSACAEALARIGPRISMEAVEQIVESTPTLTNLQKDFYRIMLAARKERIIDAGLERIQQARSL